MYRTIDTSYWNDPAVKALSPIEKLLLLYLITNPHAHVGGIYYLPSVTIAYETGIPESELDTLFDTLSRPKTEQDRVGFIRRDRENHVIWVINMLTYQGKGEKINRSVAAVLKSLHKCSLIKDFISKYPSVKKFYKDRVSDRVSQPWEKLGEVGIQEQEQDKEEENEISSAIKLYNLFPQYPEIWSLKLGKKMLKLIQTTGSIEAAEHALKTALSKSPIPDNPVEYATKIEFNRRVAQDSPKKPKVSAVAVRVDQ